jgi:hypothetical protein
MFAVECRPGNEAQFTKFIGIVATTDWSTTPPHHSGHKE